METKIIQIATALMELQDKGYYTAFFGYSGHVEHFNITIYKGKWLPKKQPLYDNYIHIRSEKAIMDEVLACIETPSEYKPKEKPITIAQHLPFFRPFDENKRVTFSYKRRKYTAMGLFKTTDFGTNANRLDDIFLKENTPEGYQFEDFYKTAKAQGVILKTDIFQYRNRLIVPCTGCLKTFSVSDLLH